jgi:hypothetical protein
MKSLLDSTFRYTPSFRTDLRKTFARARRDQAQAESHPVVVELGRVAGNPRCAPVKPGDPAAKAS